jgi:hypothetical protein
MMKLMPLRLGRCNSSKTFSPPQTAKTSSTKTIQVIFPTKDLKAKSFKKKASTITKASIQSFRKGLFPNRSK